MGGGHYDYIQFQMRNVADQMWCEANSKEFTYSDETKDRFMEAVRLLRRASILMQRIDWLLSGDDGEDTFHERLKADLTKPKGEGE